MRVDSTAKTIRSTTIHVYTDNGTHKDNKTMAKEPGAIAAHMLFAGQAKTEPLHLDLDRRPCGPEHRRVSTVVAVDMNHLMIPQRLLSNIQAGTMLGLSIFDATFTRQSDKGAGICLDGQQSLHSRRCIYHVPHIFGDLSVMDRYISCFS